MAVQQVVDVEEDTEVIQEAESKKQEVELKQDDKLVDVYANNDEKCKGVRKHATSLHGHLFDDDDRDEPLHTGGDENMNSIVEKLVRKGILTMEDKAVNPTMLIDALTDKRFIPPTRTSKAWAADHTIANGLHAILTRCKSKDLSVKVSYPMPLATFKKMKWDSRLQELIQTKSPKKVMRVRYVPLLKDRNHWVALIIGSCKRHPGGCASLRDPMKATSSKFAKAVGAILRHHGETPLLCMYPSNSNLENL